LKIGFNLIQYNPDYTGGVNSFSVGLLKGFCRVAGADNTIVVLVTEQNKTAIQKELSGHQNYSFMVYNDKSVADRIAWKLSSWALNNGRYAAYSAIQKIFFGAIRKEVENSLDILYTPTTFQFPAFLKIPTVLSMHDIQHEHFPNFFSKADLVRRKVLYEFSARHAGYLQASSRYICEDFMHHFNFLKQKNILQIPEGVDIALFSRENNSDVVKKYALPSKFLFYPAQLWPHKNHLRLLKAVKEVQKNHHDIHLVMTGGKGDAYETVMNFIKEGGLENTTHYLGKVPFDDIIALYHACYALINTSLHESNCLPVFEAIASGRPVLASNIPPNLELEKYFKLNLFNAEDEKNIAEKISDLWNNDSKAAEQVKSNKLQINLFSWEEVAGMYISCFNKIVEVK